MADLARPEYGTPWASEGEIVAPTQDKVELGWVQEMMPFQWENYLQNRQDSAITYLLQKGIPEYSGTQEYIAQKSAVLYMGAVYIATQTVTGVLPTVTASWKRLSTISDASGVVSITGGGTGASTASGARTNLGLGTASVLDADVVVQKDASGNFSAGTITASLAGNATSAGKWKTARTINITGAATSDTKSMDGTANTTLTISELDATKLVGTATVNTSGNAATATKLQTVRTITLTGGASGVSNASDGSTDFTISVANLNASNLGSGTVPVPALSNAVTKTAQTGSAALPSGTTAERDTLPQESYFRYNKTTKLPEFYDGTSWKSATGLNTGNFVSKTSDTGAAMLPAGTEAQRPSAPTGGLNLRLNLDTGKPEWYDYITSSWKAVGSGGGYMFERGTWGGTRATIPLGFVPRDGQVIYDAAYPEACAAIRAGVQQTVTEAEWQADPLKRGKWSLGDGSTWVRVPDSNGVQAGSIGGLVEAGDYGGTRTGQVLGDAIRNITASTQIGHNYRETYSSLQGAFRSSGSGSTSTNAARGPTGTDTLTFDASNVVPTADENRAKTEYGVKIIRVFMEVTDSGTTDVAALIGQVAELSSNIDFTIIYPNGGTEAAPANASINSRYVVANPFPGHSIICQAEIMVGGKWGITSWMAGSSSAAGTLAAEFDGSIVIQTGSGGLTREGGWSGQPNPAVTGLLTTPSPFRVKVWKVKGSTS